MLNGLSWITDDISIARFIVTNGFPADFSDEANSDPDCREELKINSSNVCNHFLSMYQRAYESQMFVLLQHFLEKNEDEASLKVL